MGIYSIRFERKVPIWVEAEIEGESLEDAIKYLMEEFPDYPDEIPLTQKTCGLPENNFENIEIYSRDEGAWL